MKKDKIVLKVVFRKFEDNQIIALFPEMTNKKLYRIESYMKFGQHSECDTDIVKITKPATESDYKELLKELQFIYDHCEFKIMKRLSVKW